MQASASAALSVLPHGWRWRTVLGVLLAVLALVTAVVLVDRLQSPSSDGDGVTEYLATIPTARAAVGSIALDGALAEVIARLGPPDALGPDIEGVARQWSLPGDAQLSVTPPVGASEPIVGIVATIPSASPVRFGLYGGVLLGDASMAEVVAAWGEPEARGGPDDDFDLRYVECRGVHPIVLKVQWEPDFDRVLIGYADEPAGSSGCGTVTFGPSRRWRSG